MTGLIGPLKGSTTLFSAQQIPASQRFPERPVGKVATSPDTSISTNDYRRRVGSRATPKSSGTCRRSAQRYSGRRTPARRIERCLEKLGLSSGNTGGEPNYQ